VDRKSELRTFCFSLATPQSYSTLCRKRDKQNRFDVDFIAQATRLGEPSAHVGQNIQGTVPASALDKIKAEGICNQNSNFRVVYIECDLWCATTSTEKL
jgi:hypothetical protein